MAEDNHAVTDWLVPRRVLLMCMTDHGIGHFLSACIMYGRFAEAAGIETVGDLRGHRGGVEGVAGGVGGVARLASWSSPESIGVSLEGVVRRPPRDDTQKNTGRGL